LGDEEDGLLAHYNDVEEQDAELFEDQDRFESHSRDQPRADENNQQVSSEAQQTQSKKPTMFGIGDEEEEEDVDDEHVDKSGSR
jgi:hypothetical protein